MRWYHRAVEAGSEKATYSVGMCYLEGDGVDKDEEKAIEYLQKAAELGHIPVLYMIGCLLMERGS